MCSAHKKRDVSPSLSLSFFFFFVQYVYEVKVYQLAETATLYYGKHFLSKGYEEKKKAQWSWCNNSCNGEIY